jgi:amidophosphoribosyltransferase
MCGLVAVLGGTDAPSHARAGLVALQHRGQESAGLSWFARRELQRVVGDGLVERAVPVALPPAATAAGHVRYATSFRSSIERERGIGAEGPSATDPAAIQPLVGSLRGVPFVLVHNGQVRLRPEADAMLRRAGRSTDVATDSAWLVGLVEVGEGDLATRVARLGSLVEGAFSVAVVADNELVISRDSGGIRPLFIGFGASKDRVVVASEPFDWPSVPIAWESADSPLVRAGTTTAFRLRTDAAGASKLEVDDEARRATPVPARRSRPPALCLLETIYFAAPSTVLVEPAPVEHRRERLGEALARLETCQRPKAPLAFDLVVGVPDSGLAAARGFARELKVPLAMGLRRRPAALRSFLAPTPLLRARIVQQKLQVDPDVVRGRHIVVIDDSVVRGTTSRAVAAMLHEAGARSVHLRLASPRLVHPCQLGVDMPTRDELVAHQHPTDEALAVALGFASIGFLPLEHALPLGGGPACTACFRASSPEASSTNSSSR